MSRFSQRNDRSDVGVIRKGGQPVPRTPIPEHLIHRPEEVERNAQRFDQLCRLAEEVALPVMQRALLREAATTGAEALAAEARTALDGVLDEAILAGVEDRAVIDQIKRSLEDRMPEPDEKEWRSLTRDAAQIVMSVWLETLRADLSKKPFLQLSEYLLPVASPNSIQRIFSFIKIKPDIPRSLAEPVASLPITEAETAEIMSIFRAKLFSEPRRVDLPFDLVIAGAPLLRALAMNRSTYERLEAIVRAGTRTARPAREIVPIKPERYDVGDFVTPDARLAVANLSAKMSPDDYKSLWQEAAQV